MPSTPHSNLVRTCHAILCATVALLTQLAVAQDNENRNISADALEYYLVQAFQAPSAKDRIALNHIGIEAQAVTGGYMVTASLEGYPAHQAGIGRGDKILRVDGEPFHPVYSFNSRDPKTDEFAAATTTHQLEFESMGAVETVEIAAVFENLYDSYRSATLNSVQEFSLGNKIIGYIRFWGLSRSTADLFTLELTMHELTGSDGLIVDLRNSYGFLSSKHLDLLTRDDRSYFDVSGPSNRHAEIAQSFPIASAQPFTKPIVVMVNSETRAGAELFAYELSKSGRVTTLGENSPGRIGAYAINEDTLDYSPADEVLIDGQRFESIGVVPEEPILFPFTQSGRSDPQFQFSVDILLGII